MPNEEDKKLDLEKVDFSSDESEEGLDISEVSAVIFYEPVPSAIRKIQRQGRTARLAPGKLFILSLSPITSKTLGTSLMISSLSLPSTCII